MSSKFTSALCAGLAGFFAVGGITLFADDPLMAMLCASLPAGLISVYFEKPDDAKLFAPYFVCGIIILLFYSIIYNLLLQLVNPRFSVTILFILIALISSIFIGIQQ